MWPPVSSLRSSTSVRTLCTDDIVISRPGPLPFELRPAVRRRRAGWMDQVLDPAHTLDAPRLLSHALDVLRALHEAAQEHDAILGVDADLALRDVGAAEQLALDLLGERDVVGRLLGPPARVDGPSRDPDRVRLGAPGTGERAALSAAESRHGTV